METSRHTPFWKRGRESLSKRVSERLAYVDFFAASECGSYFLAAARRAGRLLLAVVLAAIPHALAAYSGTVSDLPLGPQPARPKSGLRLVIDTRWVEANGYRPVRIEAVNWPPGPALADRSLRVVLQPRPLQWPRGSARVTGYVEIPEGAARGQTTLAVPQSDAWGSLAVWVYEDGQLLEDLSTSVGMGIGMRAYNYPSEALPAILIVDSDAPPPDARELLIQQRTLNPASRGDANAPRQLPDVQRLLTLLPEADQNRSYGAPKPARAEVVDDVGMLLVIQDMPRVELLPPSALPTRWIDFTCFDLVFITLADAKGLAANQPAAWKALCDWAATGPTLCVYDMELSAEQLAQVESLVGLTAASGATDSVIADNPWKPPDPGRDVEEITALKVVRQSNSMSPEEVKSPPSQPTSKASPAPDYKPFVYRVFRRGRVVAMRTDSPLAADRYEAAWLLNELDGKSWMWYQRHGMSWHRENNDYWNWIVPGIGRAPVGTFLLLITAFVIVIGPVNYFFLRRRRRLYLLLVTVPAGAGLVTLALFAYALLSDGLGVRVRVRSFTEIDQRAGHAVSWSRQSYYAGLAPSGGLKFPERAAVLPIDQYPAERRDGRLGMQQLVWSEGQNLVSGYIGARSTAQFLVVESGPSRRGLLVVAGQAPVECQATNNLAAAIDTLIVKDDAGRVRWAKDLAIGQSQRLESVDPVAAQRELQAAFGVNRPAFPPGYQSHSYRGLGFSGRYYHSWSNVDRNLPNPTFASGILERSLQATLGGDVRTWPPRSYVAITRTSPGVSLGHERAREEASFHVVYGSW